MLEMEKKRNVCKLFFFVPNFVGLVAVGRPEQICQIVR